MDERQEAPERILRPVFLSDTRSRTKNYIVIFSTMESSLDGLSPIAHTYTRTPPASETQAVVSSYGGTWDYSYIGAVNTAATTTMNLQYADKYKVLFVRAYNQQGELISRYSPDQIRSRETTLERVILDIRFDKRSIAQQKAVVAPMSVYYVNCNVDEPRVETPKLLLQRSPRQRLRRRRRPRTPRSSSGRTRSGLTFTSTVSM